MNWMGRVLGLLLIVMPGTALAAWDETVNGDLSSNAAAPTSVTFRTGSNRIAGSVTNPADTRDYITFTIPAGHRLTAVRLVSYTDGTTGGPGNRGFHAINAGATSFVPSATTSSSFLGGDHLDPLPAGTDLLPGLADGTTAGTGFTIPLGPGTYSYLVQQTGPQISVYALDFVLDGPPPVPAFGPWSLALLASVLLCGGVIVSRRRALNRA